MAPALPTSLPQITLCRPLVNLQTAAAALDRHPPAVQRLVEDGSLPWAFDLAVVQRRRMEVRILSQCLRDFQLRQVAASRALEFDAVLQIIFPLLPPSGTIKADTIARRFNCRTDHIAHLVKSGRLRLAGAPARSGPGGSPAIEAASVIKFLRQRRIT